MAYFDWNNELSVGVELFDNHHKVLIDLINKLHNAMLSGQGSILIGDTIVELAMYTQYHFDEEERQMAAANYSGLEAHKREHAAFVRRIESFIARLDNNSVTLSTRTIRFLINWLTVHIQKTDKLYSSSIAEISDVA